MIDKNSQFYIKAKKMLEEYVRNGGKIDDLGIKTPEYQFIKRANVYDENGNYVDLETRFKELGFPRKAKCKDNKQALVAEIEEYIKSGGSFHITRKKLPFFPRLNIRAAWLKTHGIELTHEQIMKGLGYKNYSDMYYRCSGIFEVKNYRDKNGFVDSYRKNEKLKGYINNLGITLNLPNYLVVTLLADEELESCFIDTEYIEYVKTAFQQYVKDNGSLVGLKRKNPSLYGMFTTIRNYYGDGSEHSLTVEDWFDIFELGDIEHRFKDKASEEIDVEPIMEGLKSRFRSNEIHLKDFGQVEYRQIIKKSIKLGIPIKELFRNYGLNYVGNTVNRLSSVKVKGVPCLEEMRAWRDMWLDACGFVPEKGYCKEEIFEAKVKASQLAYNEYKNKMFNFVMDEAQCSEGVTTV